MSFLLTAANGIKRLFTPADLIRGNFIAWPQDDKVTMQDDGMSYSISSLQEFSSNDANTVLEGMLTTLSNRASELDGEILALKAQLQALQAVLNSDDVELDTVQEIVAFIKANRTSLADLVSGKLNVSEFNEYKLFMTQTIGDIRTEIQLLKGVWQDLAASSENGLSVDYLKIMDKGNHYLLTGSLKLITPAAGTHCYALSISLPNQAVGETKFVACDTRNYWHLEYSGKSSAYDMTIFCTSTFMTIFAERMAGFLTDTINEGHKIIFQCIILKK